MDNLVNSLIAYIHTSHMPIIILMIAFLGGIVSSLSPCSLGVLPLVIAYIGGYSKENSSKRILIQLLSFSLGLSVILSFVGVLCALTGKAFTSISSPLWIVFLSSLILIFGLNLIGVLEIPFPTLIKKMPFGGHTSLFIYPALIGMAFALATTPCSSPILATIMAMASLSANIVFSIALLFLFALGQCLIVVICGLFASTLKNLKAMSHFTEYLMKISGVVFIIFAFYLYYRIFSPLIG